MGTGTTSDADWACQGYEKNVFSFLFDSKGVATGFGISREALSKRIPWAQARLQMQIMMSRLREERLVFR